MGRSINYNKTSRVKLTLVNIALYFMFYLEIFMETKMFGNVSQVLIVWDAADIALEHFKFSVKMNISDCLRYGP